MYRKSAAIKNMGLGVMSLFFYVDLSSIVCKMVHCHDNQISISQNELKVLDAKMITYSHYHMVYTLVSTFEVLTF